MTLFKLNFDLIVESYLKPAAYEFIQFLVTIHRFGNIDPNSPFIQNIHTSR